jgi:hypothetical protein
MQNKKVIVFHFSHTEYPSKYFDMVLKEGPWFYNESITCVPTHGFASKQLAIEHAIEQGFEIEEVFSSTNEYWKITRSKTCSAWFEHVNLEEPYSLNTEQLTHGDKESIIEKDSVAQDFIDWAIQIEGWFDGVSEPLEYGVI